MDEILRFLDRSPTADADVLASALKNLALTGDDRAAERLGRILLEERAQGAFASKKVRTAALDGLFQLDTHAARLHIASALTKAHLEKLRPMLLLACVALQAAECQPALMKESIRLKDFLDSEDAIALIGGKVAQDHIMRGRDPTKTLTTYTAVLLGHLATDETLNFLLRVAREHPEKMRMGADVDVAWALGRSHNPAARQVLRKMVKSRREELVYFAALSLAQLGDRASLPSVRRAIEKAQADKNRDRMLRCCEWTWDRYALLRRQFFRKPEYLLALHYASAKLGAPGAREAIRRASKSDDALEALEADRFLLLLGEDDAALRMLTAVPALVATGLVRQGYSTERTMRRENVLAALRSLIDLRPAIAAELLVELAASPDAKAQMYALMLHARIDPAIWIETYVKNLGSAEDEVRTEAYQRLRLAGRPALDALVEALPRLKQRGRVLATTLLGEVDGSVGKAALARLAGRDPTWQVRWAAQRSLALRDRAAGHARANSLQTCSIRTTGWQRDVFVYGPTAGLPKDCSSLAEWDQKLYLASSEGLWVNDGLGFKPLEATGLCAGPIQAVAGSAKGLWVVSADGVAIGDGRRFDCRRVRMPAVFALAVDGDGLLVGTQAGLSRLHGRKLQPVPGSPARAVRTIARQGKTHWVAFEAHPAVWDRKRRPGKAGRSDGAMQTNLYHLQPQGLQPADESLRSYWPVESPLAVNGLDVRDQAVCLATDLGVLRLAGGIADARFEPWPEVGRMSGADAVVALDRNSLLAVFGNSLAHWKTKRGWDACRLDEKDLPGRTEAAGTSGATQPAPHSALLHRANGDVWLALEPETAGGAERSQLIRIAGRNPAERKWPPETVVASARAGVWHWRNPELEIRMPNRARRAGADEAIRVPAAQVAIEAAAQDPWDYDPVAFQFKLDERPWSAWQADNGLLTPLLADGPHLIRVRARDAQGNTDPSPAELRFVVHTREPAVIRILDGEFSKVFPSQYRRLEREGLGRVQLENRATEPMRVKVNLKLRDLFPTPATRSLTLPAGSKHWVNLPAPFDERLLGVPSGQVQAVVEVDYEHQGLNRQVRQSFGLQIEPSNAFDWSDPTRLAALIHNADPQVERFSAAVISAARPAGKVPLPMRNIALAAALYRGLYAHGVRYQADPSVPFGRIRPGEAMVDSVRFPAQTLADKLGDCDDLVVLYASLLEAADIPVYIAPVQGHVYLLFDSGVSVDNRGALLIPEKLQVAHAGRICIPVEVTLLGREPASFQRAWFAGAETHARYRPKAADLFSVRKAWAQTPPVFPAGPVLARPPERIARAGRQEIERMLTGYTQRVLAQAPAARDPKSRMARARFLAKNGLFAQAEAELVALGEKDDSFEVQHALGVVRLGAERLQPAIRSLLRARRLARDAAQRFQASLALASAYRAADRLTDASRACEDALAANPAAAFDARYTALVRFLSSPSETKGSGGSQLPGEHLQLLLSAL